MLRSGDRMSLSSSSRSTTVRCMAFVPLSALVRVLRRARTSGERGGPGSLRGFGELFSGRVAVGVTAGGATGIKAGSATGYRGRYHGRCQVVLKRGGSGGTGGGSCAGLIDVEPPLLTPEQIRDDGHERPNPGTR